MRVDADPNYLAAVGQSGPAMAEATLLVYDTAGITVLEEIDLPIIGGAVTLSATAATYASLDLEVAVADETVASIIADTGSDALAPYGNEIRVRVGAISTAGAGWVSLGIFRIDRTTMADDGGLTVRIDGLDRSAAVIESGFRAAGQIPAGTGCGTAIIETVLSYEINAGKFDYNESEFADADEVTLPLLSYEDGGDRWDTARAIAEAANGARIYFDGAGKLRLTTPVSNAEPVATIAEGPGGVLLGATKDFAREGGCNRVRVLGESSTTAPVRGVAVDDDPASPFHVDGKFGTLTFEYSSEYITDQTQAEQVAQTILDQKRGASQAITFSALTNAALEPDDTVRIRRSTLKIDEDHIIDELSIPLGTEEMTGSTRVYRVIE